MSLDGHAADVLANIDQTERWLAGLLSTNAPGAHAQATLQAITFDLAESLKQYDEFELCELLRVAMLPWSVGGEVRPGTEKGPALVELLMLIRLAGPDCETIPEPVDPNSLVEAWQEKADDLLTVAQIAAMAQVRLSGTPEALAKIQLSTTFREIWMRNSSYPDMVVKTFADLFGAPEVEAAMRQSVGFVATEALKVLDSLHHIQLGAWNRRLDETFGVLDDLMANDAAGELQPDDPQIDEFQQTWEKAWNAKYAEIAVTPESISADSGVPLDIVQSIIDAFSIDTAGRSGVELVRAFATGDNPWRTNPLLVGPDGAVMLVHDAMNLPAVRENSEQLLRDTPAWETYQAHRSKVLEDRVREAFESLLPGASVRAGYEYYVPATENESNEEPSRYTKRVEGDLLIIVDDVAVVVESKAIATNPQARAGDTRLLRRDLVGMIGNASKQASRAAERIRLDGGLRVHGEGWIDLSAIREVHLAAVSLDDLSGVATATGDLIDAGILQGEEIPWTVSLHDLQIIRDLVDTPAEFLLYLRRRRDPETARFYMAPDELDLFLYFYEEGLYVPPDPAKVQAELPFMRPETAGLRRREKFARRLITSRTDPLDKWHWSVTNEATLEAPKPTLQHSPMKQLAAELATRRDFGWLSIGATLLSGSTKAQADMMRQPSELLKNPDPLGRERSATVPIGATREDAWLIVWITRPATRTAAAAESHARSYIHAKKYQLGITRAVALQYSEVSGHLEGVFYEGAPLVPDPELDERIKLLVPPDKIPHRRPPHAKRRPKNR